VDGKEGRLQILVDEIEWAARDSAPRPQGTGIGCGRELFAFMRAAFSPAEEGASAFTAELDSLR